jgi:hypothetical protein
MTTQTEWAESPAHPGYCVKVITHEACTIRILRPLLADAERAKRLERIKQAATRLLLEAEKAKKKKNKRLGEKTS